MSIATIRLVHYYAGVFFAPTIIFFALSGVMQVFKLHESYLDTPGAQGGAAAWMSLVHKESALIVPKAAPAKAPAPRPERNAAFKWFAALMGVSLIGASLAGLWIAFNYPARRRSYFATLIAGIVVPIAILQLGAMG